MRAPYPTYKSTSIPCLSEMPEHWDIRRAKYVFRVIDDKTAKGDEELLSVSEHYGVLPRRNANVNTFKAESYEGYKLCKKGDLVINSLWAWSRGLGVSEHEGIVSNAYSVFRLKVPANHRFFHYLLRTEGYVAEYLKRSKGIWISRLQLSDLQFLDLPLPLPPLTEQTAIANYLDAKAEQINRFIEKKQKLIALLKEQKQAVINELLEDKEGKWERRKLRHAIKGKLKYGANESGIPYNPEYPRYIRITDFGSDGKLRDDDMLSLLPSVAKAYILKDGDILFARSGGTVGKTFQYKKSDTDASLSCYAGYLIKAEPNEKIILSDFLYIYTLSGYYEQWKQGIFNKATIENIGADKYSQLLIPVPPIETQKLILSNINSETTKIDDAILRIEREIEKVKELKQSLIAEVVTGRIKVV